MNVAICSARALAKAVETFDPDAVVSVSLPGRRTGGRLHIRLHIDDVEVRSPETVAPRHRHVQQILGLADYKWMKRLRICCSSGLSHSPALAIVAAVKAGHDPVMVCEEIKRLVPHCQPNRLVLAVGTEVLRRDILTPALRTFTYTRGRSRPTGERVGLVELELHLAPVVVEAVR
jgi:hypothetical protein